MSIDIRGDNMPHIKNAQSSFPYDLTHEDEIADRYREYLIHEDEPDDSSRNPRNLFHELNSIDTQWLNIARAHLSRVR
jgi:hypothetical protein